MKKAVVDKKAAGTANKAMKKPAVAGPKSVGKATKEVPVVEKKVTKPSKTTQNAMKKGPAPGKKAGKPSKITQKAMKKAPAPGKKAAKSIGKKAPVKKAATKKSGKKAKKAGKKADKIELEKKKIDKRLLAASEKEPDTILYSLFGGPRDSWVDDLEEAGHDHVEYLGAYSSPVYAHVALAFAVEQELGGENPLSDVILGGAAALPLQNKDLHSISIGGSNFWIECNAVSQELINVLEDAKFLDAAPSLL